MNRRGLGISCPQPVADALRSAGWRGHNGWWFMGTSDTRLRWYDALAESMRLARAAPPRCERTPDMFGGAA